MTRLFTSFDLVEVEFRQAILQDSGIACTVRNIFSRTDVPSPETWPELWALRDSDVPHAQALLAERVATAPANLSAWTCPACGTTIEPQFQSCWNCGADRPALAERERDSS